MIKWVLYILFFGCVVFTSCKSHKTVTTSSNTNNNTKPKTETSSGTIQKIYALKLGVPEKNITNKKLYEFINDWVGVPYKYAGKDKAGIDCSGLTAKLYASVFGKTVSSATKILITEVKKIPQTDLQEGDLVFFNIGSSNPTHVGVYLQNNKFIHSSTKKGVMISDLNEPYFKKYFMTGGKVK